MCFNIFTKIIKNAVYLQLILFIIQILEPYLCMQFSNKIRVFLMNHFVLDMFKAMFLTLC